MPPTRPAEDTTSSDRLTGILRYLTAISHDAGELRAGVKDLRKDFVMLRGEVGELREGQGELRAEARALTKRFDRLEARVLDIRADTADFAVRVSALEGKGQ